MAKQLTHDGVVVGVDGSPLAQHALRWAVGEATMRHVPLTVVHVAAPTEPGAFPVAWPAVPIPEEVIQQRVDNARALVADAVTFAKDRTDGIEVDGELLFGGPLPTLIDLSKRAQLVVVGARGKTGLRRVLLGSVSNGLIRHAHCPVAVIPDEPPEGSKLPVVVGVDGSRASEAAVAIAFDEASWRGVDLVALHVWSDDDVRGAPSLEWSTLETQAEKILAQSLAGWQERYPDVKVHRIVEFDQPARHLLERAERAQLVVVGSHGRGGFVGMLLGSVSTAVVQAAPVPVIIARSH